jgi:hypothetical protein
MDDCATSAKALDLYAGIFSGLEAATERGTNAFTRGIRLKASPD